MLVAAMPQWSAAKEEEQQLFPESAEDEWKRLVPNVNVGIGEPPPPPQPEITGGTVE